MHIPSTFPQSSLPRLEVAKGTDIAILGGAQRAGKAAPVRGSGSAPLGARVLVVGAGPAGLAAALELEKLGIREVTVCEATDHVMGRSNSFSFARGDGSRGVGQIGAQIAPQSYGPFWRAVSSLGLESSKRNQSTNIAMATPQGAKVFDISNPLDFFRVEHARGGAILDDALWREITESMQTWLRLWHHRLPDASDHWVGLDEERSTWFRRELGDAIGSIADSELATLYFKRPEQASTANIASVAACGLRGEHGETLTGGFGEIGPVAMKRLQARYGDHAVRLSTPVTKLKETAKGVVATINGRTETYDYVVLATPSDIAATIAPPKTEAERAIRGRSYIPTVNVIVGFKNISGALARLRDQGIYGLVTSPAGHGPNDFVVATSFHSGAGTTQSPGRDTLQFMALGDKVRDMGLLDMPAKQLVAKTLASMERHVPGISSLETELEVVVKHPAAIVDSPPGLSARQQAYKDQVGTSRIVDAGSHLNIADRIGGAWRSGESAAIAIANMVRRSQGAQIARIYPAVPAPQELTQSERARYDQGAYGASVVRYGNAVKDWGSSLAHGDIGGAARAWSHGWKAWFAGTAAAVNYWTRR